MIIHNLGYPRIGNNRELKKAIEGYWSATIRGIRENIIYDGKGNIIGKAKGLWVFFDIKRRRPIQIFDSIKEKWSSDQEESINYNITKKIEAIDSANFVKEFKVNQFDVYTNEYVNNIRYRLQELLLFVPDPEMIADIISKQTNTNRMKFDRQTILIEIFWNLLRH